MLEGRIFSLLFAVLSKTFLVLVAAKINFCKPKVRKVAEETTIQRYTYEFLADIGRKCT